MNPLEYNRVVLLTATQKNNLCRIKILAESKSLSIFEIKLKVIEYIKYILLDNINLSFILKQDWKYISYFIIQNQDYILQRKTFYVQ